MIFDDIVSGTSSGLVKTEVQNLSVPNRREVTSVLRPEFSGGATQTSGEICNANTDLYSPYFNLPGAVDNLILALRSTGGKVPSDSFYFPVVCLYDLLWKATVKHNWGADGNSVYFTPPPLTRYQTGEGVYPILFASDFRSSLMGSNMKFGVRGVDDSGVAERYTANAIFTSESDGTVGNMALNGPEFWMSPPAGSGGMRSITQLYAVNPNNFYVSGSSLVVALVKPLAFIPFAADRDDFEKNFSQACSSILRLPAGSDGDKPCLIAAVSANHAYAFSDPALEFTLAAG